MKKARENLSNSTGVPLPPPTPRQRPVPGRRCRASSSPDHAVRPRGARKAGYPMPRSRSSCRSRPASTRRREEGRIQRRRGDRAPERQADAHRRGGDPDCGRRSGQLQHAASGCLPCQRSPVSSTALSGSQEAGSAFRRHRRDRLAVWSVWPALPEGIAQSILTAPRNARGREMVERRRPRAPGALTYQPRTQTGRISRQVRGDAAKELVLSRWLKAPEKAAAVAAPRPQPWR